MMLSGIKPTPIVLNEFARGCLGLTGVELPRKAELALHARFRSLPYQKRFDPEEVGEHLQTIGLAIDAMGRLESQKTIRGNSDLVMQASDLVQKLKHLAGLA